MIDKMFDGDLTPSVKDFAADVYLCEFFIDQLEAATLRIERHAKDNGLYMNDNKQAIKRVKHVVSEMTAKQHRTLGADDIALNFGENSDLMADIMKELIFLSMDTKRRLYDELQRTDIERGA